MDIIFLTGANMPSPDYETHILVEKLAQKGIKSKVCAWNSKEDWANVKLVVVRTTWDYHENLDQFLQQIKFISSQTNLINEVETIEWNINKKYLKELESEGLPIVPTTFIDKGKIISKNDLKKTGFEKIVIKPSVSLGAIGAIKTTVDDENAVIHANNLLNENDILIQPFVESVYTGEASLLFFDNKFSHAVLKVPKKGEYRVQDTYGGSVIPYPATDEEIEIAKKAISFAPGNLSYARVDFLNINNKPYLMELELIEPNIFIRYSNVCIDNFTKMLKNNL